MNRTRSLIKYVLTKILLSPIILITSSSLVFLLLRVAPGDPVDAILGLRADEIAREALRTNLGLDKPLINQYFSFIYDLLHLNLGESLISKEPVINIIFRSLPATTELTIVSVLLAIIIGSTIGLIGIKNNKFDVFSRLWGITTYAIPPFWAAMIVQIIFSVKLKLLPIGGRFPFYENEPRITGFMLVDSLLSNDFFALRSSLLHLLLPSLTMAVLISGVFSRSLKMNLEEALNSDYVEAAKCRGINDRRILINHALPNALIPILTLSGLTIASLAGGALLIEVVFSWPGIALRLQEAIQQRDYNVVQGIVIVIAFIIVLINTLVDIIIAIIDPRVRF
tara:strand:- start:6667 stop:7680 length:1014 start_codon:yes stop_codon:yes gene_type:complete